MFQRRQDSPWGHTRQRTDAWSGEGSHFRRWMGGARRRRSGHIASALFWAGAMGGTTAAIAWYRDPYTFDRMFRQARAWLVQMLLSLDHWT